MKTILLDFVKDNLRRFFWMGVILVIALLLWVWIKDLETPKTLLIGVGTYALTQFRGQLQPPKKDDTN